LSTSSAAAVVEGWLAPFGMSVPPLIEDVYSTCPQLQWAASGAMQLSGAPDGPPAFARGAIIPLLDAVIRRLDQWASIAGGRCDLESSVVLGARSAGGSRTRRGQVSVGGTARILRSLDGWCAINLARDDDLSSVPAIVEERPEVDPWAQLSRAVASRRSAEICDRAALFGVPARVLNEQPNAVQPWRISRVAAAGSTDLEGALVVDLSSLWAGPLCSRILGEAGARVIKVESTHRPDSARRGDRRLFDWLHEDHESVALDFANASDRCRLADLVRAADVVIEASRPRALAQLGLSPEHDLKAGGVWVSITGRGRSMPDAVGFGDDAAVGGGLVADTAGGPVFCADAIADPLTGMVAGLGALAGLRAGGGVLVDVAMSAVAEAFAAEVGSCTADHRVVVVNGRWFAECLASGGRQLVARPKAPPSGNGARPYGSDTSRVLAELCSDLARD
jgi:hypothetical protein